MSNTETTAPRAQTNTLSIAEGAEKLAATRNAGGTDAIFPRPPRRCRKPVMLRLRTLRLRRRPI